MAVKHLFIAFILICSIHLVWAQSQWTEAVYLKNGTIIKGMIIEQVPNVSLKIKTKDGSIFVFKYEEIEKITKEQTNRRIPSAVDTNVYKPAAKAELTRFEYTKTGLWFNPRLGVMAPSGFTVGVVGGFQPNKHWALGLGASLDQYIDFTNGIVTSDDNTSSMNSHDAEKPIFLPIYFQNRLYFAFRRASPFIFVDLGYSFFLQSNRAHYDKYLYGSANPTSYYSTINSGGTIVNIGGGIRMASSNKLAFTIDAGLLFQGYSAKIETEYTDNNNNTNLVPSFETKLGVFPTIKFGILF